MTTISRSKFEAIRHNLPNGPYTCEKFTNRPGCHCPRGERFYKDNELVIELDDIKYPAKMIIKVNEKYIKS